MHRLVACSDPQGKTSAPLSGVTRGVTDANFFNKTLDLPPPSFAPVQKARRFLLSLQASQILHGNVKSARSPRKSAHRFSNTGIGNGKKDS